MVMIYLLISIGYKNNGNRYSRNLFGVSQSLGTKTGFYIGRIDKFIRSVSREEAVASSRDIILFSLLLAKRY